VNVPVGFSSESLGQLVFEDALTILHRAALPYTIDTTRFKPAVFDNPVFAWLPLRGKAKAGETWADLYWVTLMDAGRLTGDRAGALKDLSDYRTEFKGEGYIRRLEQVAQGI